ncbi:MAG: NAD-dependent DNA ligase LigA [Eubacterium sp.]|nr:NAD-dependent DNA ligase LigA [Eubacterium sp.]
MDKEKRIEELVKTLNEASLAYYNDRDEIMSNFEWDSAFDELSKLEEQTGYILPDSPTQNTGAEENISSGQRERHEYPALSLAKSKDVEVLIKWAGVRPIWLSWKLDGITLVATYDDGKLTKLMTRGQGEYGNNITYLSPYISGLPEKIKEKGHMVVRGEAVISYTDFETINDLTENEEEQYANPRNLVAGTMSLDISRAGEVKERKVSFNAFTLVHLDREMISWGDRMNYLEELGFTCVARELTDAGRLREVIERWSEKVKNGNMDIPVDGLVISYDDTAYAATGSVTGHHATNAGMAYKWQDKPAKTVLDHIEWSCAANSISPVAVFEPVQLEGTEVKRASLCNITEMKRLGIGADKKTDLTVIKANMIIPKCVAADGHGTSFEIPKKCPVCGAPTEILIGKALGTETLHCTNEDCIAKHIQKFSRFVSKSGMDIDGLSIKTINKFINEGFISDYADIYDIKEHRKSIETLEGFGEKSYNNIINSIESSRKVHPVNFIYALSIPLIGIDAAKKFISSCGTEGFFERLYSATGFDDIDGIGPEKSGSVLKWYELEKNKRLLSKLLERIEIEKVMPTEEKSGSLKDLVFVITGDVHDFKNRDEFKAYVESQGGKVTGSVSKKTNYLVNNDIMSPSSKNTKAKELGIEIITEDTFIERFGR